MSTDTLIQQRILPAEPPATLSELYHENSKQRRHDHAFFRRIASVNNDPAMHALLARVFTRYPGATVTTLSSIQVQQGSGFEQLVAGRRSIRQFTGEPVELDQLASLMFCGGGITGELEAMDQGWVQPIRAAPSGGALYPIEMYVAVRQVNGIEPGIHHYHPRLHALELVSPGETAGLLGNASSDSSLFEEASATIVLTAMFARTKFKYGERGYRFALLEAGHIAQNLLLATSSMGLGATAVGGFIDDEVNDLLGIDGVDEACLYLIPFGHPAIPAGHVDSPDLSAFMHTAIGQVWNAWGARNPAG